MSRVCQVTKKKPRSGVSYSIRGIAKKHKGIGLKINGKTKRRFLPNLMKKRFWLSEENRFVSLKISMDALRTIDKLGISHIVKQLRAEGQKI